MTPARGKVLVAMSGGVDSSVAAAMLLRAGYEVVGVFMRLGSPGEALDEFLPFEQASPACATDPHSPGAASGAAPGRAVRIGKQGCCSINDAADARAVAAELSIPFYVCNFKKDFGRIIDYFVGEYASGRTPNPCVRCNDWLKFGKLRSYAEQIGADFVASGHYARVRSGPESPSGAPALLRAIDHSKDQSYVLFGVPRTHLPNMLLPIGGMHKPEVRDLAKAWGLPVFDKPDSQEICFVPDNDYARLVEQARPGVAASGRIVDTDGNQVGTHSGQHRFTIGQRRGVSVALGYPVYVVGKDAATNTVTVGARERLLASACEVAEANWLVDQTRFVDWTPVIAKYRYNTPGVRARARLITPQGAPTAATPSGREGRFEVAFDDPQSAVAPGQALVLYDASEPDVVLGGGWIQSATASQAHT